MGTPVCHPSPKVMVKTARGVINVHGILPDPKPLAALLPRIGRPERTIEEVGDLLRQGRVLVISIACCSVRSRSDRLSSLYKRRVDCHLHTL